MSKILPLGKQRGNETKRKTNLPNNERLLRKTQRFS